MLCLLVAHGLSAFRAVHVWSALQLLSGSLRDCLA